MKRIFKKWMWQGIGLLIGAFLLSILLGCQTQEPEFSVLGKWKADNWYCNQCNGANPIDMAATIQFEILTIDQEGGLAITEARRIIPSCSSNCTPLPWYVVSASFVDNTLHIEWMTGHIFIGRLQGNEFVGRIEYIIPELSYLFNDDITIRRR